LVNKKEEYVGPKSPIWGFRIKEKGMSDSPTLGRTYPIY
jgi:hypothetical protein